jgi:glycosyltransferase involved in cell wall biosynthesis
VYHLHNKGINEQSKKVLQRLLYRVVFNNTHIIHLSKSLIENELYNLKLKGACFYIVPNGISFKEIKNIELLKRDTKKVQLIFVSNFMPEKGLFELLDAFQILKESYTNITLSLVGPFYKNTEKQIKKYFDLNNKFNNDIQYHGALFGDEKRKILGRSDIFVFPSWFKEECFPLVILEAMAAGLPVVTTDVGVIKEIIDDGKNGYIIPCRDKKLLVQRIENLIIDRQLRVTMGKKAREKFEKQYSLTEFEQNIHVVFKEILSSKE